MAGVGDDGKSTNSGHGGEKNAFHFHHRPTFIKRLKSMAKKKVAQVPVPPSVATSRHTSITSRHRPPSRTSSHPADNATSTSAKYELPGTTDEERLQMETERPAIKIRLVTWNHADSLPTGDLIDLLGDPESGRRRASTNSAGSAGVLGNGSIKEPSLRSSMEAGPSSARLDDDSIISIPLPAGLPRFPLSPGHPYHILVVAGQECPTASGVLAGKVPRTLDGLGWTSILEDYLCGGPEDDLTSSGSDSDTSESSGEDSDHDDETEILAGGLETSSVVEEKPSPIKGKRKWRPILKAKGKVRGRGKDAASTVGSKMKESGQYVLVEKERLMGIYLAVFCHRSSGCDAFIRGTSKGKVTAGLLGGRLGNKGAVAISLNFAGSRLLFISAHLAAHSSALELRKANIKKIMDEMVIDDFSGQESSKLELTERFDQCFFMGDLNMRLNITRLHADFLLRTPDGYLTALEFDQLRAVLAETNSALKGFKEGTIRFAPTYKYDIPKPKLKRKRSGGNLGKSLSINRMSRESKPLDPSSPLPPPIAEVDMHLSPPLKEKDSDAISVASSRGSISSAMSDFDRSLPLALHRGDVSPAIHLPSLPDSTAEAVKKAQVRFLTLVRSNSTQAVFRHLSNDSTNGAPGSPRTSFGARPSLRSIHSEQTVSKTGVLGGDEDDEGDGEMPAPCFDSSSKQRVQSYCDRILFKSNVGYGIDQQKLPLAPCGGLVNSLQQVAKPLPALPSAIFEGAPRHSCFDSRPALDHPSKKITDSKTSQSWSDVASVAGDPGQFRFANFFRRRGLSSRSTDSLGEKESSPSRNRLKRSKSLHARPSSAISSNPSDSPRLFWRGRSPTSEGMLRRESSDIPTTITGGSVVSTPATSPSLGSGLPWETPLDPEAPRPSMVPRRSLAESLFRHTASASGSSSSFFRTNTNTLTRTATRASTFTPSRFRSFFHFLPIPFLSSTSRETSSEAVAKLVQKTGPKRGEVEVLEYDAVSDLVKLGGLSDHRPVYAVMAIGIEDDDED